MNPKNSECAICIDNIEQFCHYCIFNCKHTFHNDCTYLLLISHSDIYNLKCPLCRSDIVLRKLRCFLISYYFINKCKKLSNNKKLMFYKIQKIQLDKTNEQINIFQTYKMCDAIKQKNMLLDERIANTKKMTISVIDYLL
jgi:hypothetical protein